MTTIEILPDGTDTRLVLTDPSAYFGGETQEMCESGWGTTVDRLQAHLTHREALP